MAPVTASEAEGEGPLYAPFHPPSVTVRKFPQVLYRRHGSTEEHTALGSAGKVPTCPQTCPDADPGGSLAGVWFTSPLADFTEDCNTPAPFSCHHITDVQPRGMFAIVQHPVQCPRPRPPPWPTRPVRAWWIPILHYYEYSARKHPGTPPSHSVPVWDLQRRGCAVRGPLTRGGASIRRKGASKRFQCLLVFLYFVTSIVVPWEGATLECSHRTDDGTTTRVEAQGPSGERAGTSALSQAWPPAGGLHTSPSLGAGLASRSPHRAEGQLRTLAESCTADLFALRGKSQLL